MTGTVPQVAGHLGSDALGGELDVRLRRRSRVDNAADIARRARFGLVVEAVYESLQRYLRRRVSADDVTELLDDVLVVVWRRIDDLPTGDPLPWVYGVARNTVANHRRGERRRLRLAERLEASCEDRQLLVPRSTSAAEAELWQTLDHLGADDRELVRLWAWEQLEPREIAIVLDTTPNAVSLRLSRLRVKLRSAIERQNGDRAGHEPGGQRLEGTP